jgi:hypothetical protein
MANAPTHPLMLVLACVFFGYATVNSLLFYRRARRDDLYQKPAMKEFVRSRRYGQMVWLSGIVGAVGFAVASWKLILLLWG